jgi:CrcB protein
MFSSPGFALAVFGVALFGGLGAAIRLLLSHWHKRLPLGILVANTVASVIVGITYSLAQLGDSAWQFWSLLLATGLAGGLSTFSSWAAQTSHFLVSGERRLAVLNFALNLVLPVLGASVGMILGLLLLK